MKKKLSIISLSISLIFSVFFPILNVSATDTQASDYYMVETEHPDTAVYSGAESRYDITTTIPVRERLLVTQNWLNTQNEQWLHIKYNSNNGWVMKSEVKNVEIKGQFLTSSEAQAGIRSGADRSYRQVGSLLKGQAARVTDGFTNNAGEKWVKISNGDRTGWSTLSDLEIYDGTKNYLNKFLFIKVDTLVKNGASTTAKTVYTIKQGTQITVFSSIVLNNETWFRIKDGERLGWIPAASTANQLNQSTTLYANQGGTVRSGAHASYRIVSNLSAGQKVQIISSFFNSQNERWYRVVLGKNKFGWVLSTSLATKPLKIAYLTIDDGPTVYTNRLLNMLDQYNAKATFFMINGNMNAHPADVKRMVKDGHAIGSHSVTHNKNLFYRSPQSAVSEMSTTRSTIARITGVTSNLMRVPYGSVPYMKLNYRSAMNKAHFIMWDWTVDSLDWKYNSSAYVNYTLNQVKAQNRRGEVPVILIHDRKATVDHLPELLTALTKLGYTLAPLSESVAAYQFHISR